MSMLHHVTCCKMNGEKGGFQASMLWPQFEHFSPQDISDVCFFHLHFRSSKVKEYHVFLPIWDLLFHSFQRMHKVSCVCELDLPHPSLLEEWNCVMCSAAGLIGAIWWAWWHYHSGDIAKEKVWCDIILESSKEECCQTIPKCRVQILLSSMVKM